MALVKEAGVRGVLGSPGRLPTGLASEARHSLAVAQLPPLHRDPFDCLLLTQATVDSLLLVTADSQLAAYPGPVRFMAASAHHT